MKVKCIKLIDAQTGESLKNSSWLTVGKEYHVLSVFIADSQPAEYRLLSDDGRTPGMYKADQFELVNKKLPSSWVANYEAESYFELAPKLWVEPGFWESYFDGEPDAVDVFNSEKESILSEG
ncbi:hypothetical protein MAH1_31750 [Sessilibacter sp. MAH1]